MAEEVALAVTTKDQEGRVPSSSLVAETTRVVVVVVMVIAEIANHMGRSLIGGAQIRLP